MTDRTPCLGNMSAPPRSKVSYIGLGNLVAAPDVTRVSDRTACAAMVTFRLAGVRPPVSRKRLLTLAGIDPRQRGAEKMLISRIEARTRELALPDGAAVTEGTGAGPLTLTDPLTVLSVLTKSSEAVWLKAKTPRLGVLLERVRISLIVPQVFIDRMQGEA